MLIVKIKTTWYNYNIERIMIMKEKIPNILTIIRISLTPIIMILGLTNHFYSMTIIGIIAALTDFFDGYLARKWQVTSVKGAKLDAVADKVFAISLVGCLISKNKILIIAFVLEIIIGCSNMYYHLQNKKVSSLMVGKIKTCFLFTTVITGIIFTFTKQLDFIFTGFIYATINLQILCLIYYWLDFNEYNHRPTINDNPMHKKIMEDDDLIDKTIVIDNLENLAKEYNYNNENDDIY